MTSVVACRVAGIGAVGCQVACFDELRTASSPREAPSLAKSVVPRLHMNHLSKPGSSSGFLSAFLGCFVFRLRAYEFPGFLFSNSKCQEISASSLSVGAVLECGPRTFSCLKGEAEVNP